MVKEEKCQGPFTGETQYSQLVNFNSHMIMTPQITEYAGIDIHVEVLPSPNSLHNRPINGEMSFEGKE